MSAEELLEVMRRALSESGIPFMVVGSFASTLHGEPRTTHDLDLVIDADTESLELFLSWSGTRNLYVNADGAREAVRRGGMFNLIDPASGWKVDLIMKKEGGFSRQEFDRKQVARILDSEVPVATPEDTILSKLSWARAGASERQLRDAASVIRVQAAGLDASYLARWARELGVVDLLKEAQRLAGGF